MAVLASVTLFITSLPFLSGEDRVLLSYVCLPRILVDFQQFFHIDHEAVSLRELCQANLDFPFFKRDGDVEDLHDGIQRSLAVWGCHVSHELANQTPF
jgi:hypothetical protein